MGRDRSVAIVVGSILLLVMGACGPAGGPTGELFAPAGRRSIGRSSVSLDAGVTDGGSPCPVPTLASISHEILAPRCSQGGCHAGATPAAGLALDLPLDLLQARLLQASAGSPSHMPLVTPGTVGASFLYLKVAFDPPISGEVMPPDAPLEGCALAAVRGWIEAGARP